MSRIATPLFAALAVQALAAGSLAAQRVTVHPPDPCVYDACAVRVEQQFFRGLTLVRGSSDEVVARAGFTGQAVARALSTHQAAAVDARAFQGHQTSSSIAGLFSAAAFVYLTTRKRSPGEDFYTLDGSGDVTIAVVGIGSSIFAGIAKYRADRALSRAVWHYNRTTTR